MMPTSSDHMPHLKHMRTTSRMPLCWRKGWLSKLLFLIWTFQNGSLLRIGIFYCPTLEKHMKKWWGNFMQMPFMMGMSWNVGLEEMTSQSHPPIFLSFWTSTGSCFENHQCMMTWIRRRICFRKLSKKTWCSFPMGNQLVFHHYLLNWGCSQQSFSATSILS